MYGQVCRRHTVHRPEQRNDAWHAKLALLAYIQLRRHTQACTQNAHASCKAWSSCSTSDLTQIAAQKETPGGMLHALTQLNQVLQDVLGSSFLAAYVAAADSTQ